MLTGRTRGQKLNPGLKRKASSTSSLVLLPPVNIIVKPEEYLHVIVSWPGTTINILLSLMVEEKWPEW